MSSPKTPPVNADVIRVQRGATRIWEGDEPAFATRTIDWVPTSSGARVRRYLDTVVIPPLFGPAAGPPPSPDFPVLPPYVPPPPGTTGTPDVFVPPATIPDTTPPGGSWWDLIASTYGYHLDAAPFRAAFFAGGSWEYDQSKTGGLHLALGVHDPLIDRATSDPNRCGNAVQCTPGSIAGPPGSDGATYFNGVDSRVFTNWNPLDDLGKPAYPVAGYWTTPWAPPRTTGQTTQPDPAAVNAALRDAGAYYQSTIDPHYPTIWSETWNAIPAVRHVLISGWANRYDQSGAHLLFSGTGTEDVRCWIEQGSGQVTISFGPEQTGSVIRPSWAANAGGGYGQAGQTFAMEGGEWLNAWPATNQWVYWAVELVEMAGTPVATARTRNDALQLLTKGYWTNGQDWDSFPGATIMEARELDAMGDGTTYEYVAGSPNDPLVDAAYGITYARLFINGVEAAPEQPIKGPAGDTLNATGGYPRTSAGVNYPGWMVLTPDPDYALPWTNPSDGRQFRPADRGMFAIGGQAHGISPDLDQTDPQWAHIHNPATAWPAAGVDDTERYVRGLTAGSFKGAMCDVTIRKWDAFGTTTDWGIRPASTAWPGPTLSDLYAYRAS